MPLIKPEVQKILREAGLAREESSQDNLTLEQHLSQAGLNSQELAENLTALALHSGNDALRLRALETVLKIKGALREQVTELPNFTIVIQHTGGQDFSKTQGVNPISFPRQSLSNLQKESLEEVEDSELQREDLN